MRLRWRWRDTWRLPIDLPREQRRWVVRRSAQLNRANRGFRKVQAMYLAAIGATIAIGFPRDSFEPLMSLPMVLYSGTMLTLMTLYFIALGRSTVVRSRQAMCDCGFAVCICCGYNLRGAEGEHCPECGTFVPSVSLW